jgi:hypothetical protein
VLISVIIVLLGGDGDITLCFETTQGCPNIDTKISVMKAGLEE